MMRKPGPWFVLAVLCLAGAVTALRLFPEAFPVLAVDIEMNREEALSEARALAEDFRWEPSGFRQAASFSRLDPMFQTYMELEAGGLEEIKRRVRAGQFVLYAWQVRHFSPGSVDETRIRFTPGGERYGFALRLPEDEPGTNLSSHEARDLALSGATAEWGADPTRLEFLESSQEERPGGRIDHTFVFRRADLDLKGAELRLRLRVAGNRLAEVTRFAHVPESFRRSYQATRDANNAIWLAGTVAFILLFLVLGGMGGFIHLIRTHRVEWRVPFVWGGVVAGLLGLSGLNSLPLSWMAYDTAMAAEVFVGMQVVTAGLIILLGTPVLGLIFMTGEGLLREGFPDQIQQWRLWKPGVANSTPALGITGAPYLVLGIKLGYVVLFYMAVTRLFGWWSPASSMVEPDTLATHFPWLSAVSTSLFAATWEETVFRAIPIGAAAILGRRFGRPRAWIWGAIVLQALVFGASHANYPQQPAYARVVELFPTYLAWGIVCAHFGLVPSIIGHFTYNLTLLSLPIFAAETAGIWVDRTVVMAIGLLPLIVVGFARWRYGAMSQAPEWARNRAWSRESWPEAEREKVPEREAESEEGELKGARKPPTGIPPSGPKEAGVLPRWVGGVVVLLALVGLVLWASTLRVQETPRLALSQVEAEAEARDVLAGEGIELAEEWTPLLAVDAARGLSHEFVWREGTPEHYRELLGRFLDPPRWRIRFVRFHVEPEARGEVYTVSLGPSGELLEVRHELPEGRPGANLEEEQARRLAREALQARHGVSPARAREISADETTRPNRTDWTFTFTAEEGYPLDAGEGRWTVRILGDEVAGGRGSVHVPEDWEREWRSDGEARLLFLLPLGALLLLLLLAAGIVGLVKGARGELERKSALVLGGTLLLAEVLTRLNEWPGTQGGFTPGEAFMNQVGMAVFGTILQIGFTAGGVALLGALAHTWLEGEGRSVSGPVWWGLGLGALAAGGVRWISTLVSSGPPDWPGYAPAVSHLPWLSGALTSLRDFLAATVLVLLFLAFLRLLRRTGKGWLAVPLLLVVGLTVAPNPPGTDWLVWAGAGLAAAAAIAMVAGVAIRLGWAVVPGLVAAPALLKEVETLLVRPFPGSASGAFLALLLIAGGVVLWTRRLRRSPASSTKLGQGSSGEGTRTTLTEG
jgi:membrane protease YdiL (CAAX protease family)